MATAALKQEEASAGDLAVLDQLNAAYVRSVDKADVRWFDENLTADFLNTNPDGTLIERAQFLAQIGRGSTVADIRPEDVRIRLMGDFAVIHARTAYRKADGQPGAGRYTDIWARRDGRWLCVAAHVSRA